MAAVHRFHAPGRNRDVLAVPPFEHVPDLIKDNQRRLSQSGVVIDGTSLKEFRTQARREALAICERDGADLSARSSGPLILAGHQPELSHPGVWAKHFALNGLASKVGGTPLNLIVDNDTLKSNSVHVPIFDANDPASVHLEAVPFDRPAPESPYEDRRILDPDFFRSFPDRVAPTWHNWGFEPLLPRVWQSGATIAEAFTSARLHSERAWGCRNLELRVSRLSGTDAFVRFARHLVQDLPRFREVYNAAIQQYRRNNGIRSHSHPAPELAGNEAPFWLNTATGRARATPSSDLSSLRPRALTLTLFTRLCLADFFIHGIGGGKYDEVTDQIFRDYFGIDPPAYQVLSATLHLPLPIFPASDAGLAHAVRLVRDLQWNPQQHLPPNYANDEAVTELIAEKDRLVRNEPPRNEHQKRRLWFRDLQEMTNRLRYFVHSELPAAVQQVGHLERAIEANRILRRRDYAWVFFPEETLKPFLQQFLVQS
jgi:hypothetical protein